VLSPEDAARAVAAGDDAAFRAIVDACSGRLYRMLARMLCDAAEAEDVLQDALLRAYQAVRGGRFDGTSSIYTWVYRIAANAALDALRRRARQDAEPSPPPLPASTADAVEARLALRRLAVLMADDALPRQPTC
jgi:RNA polymerase sigma-70 factor (ECF subfamily)